MIRQRFRQPAAVASLLLFVVGCGSTPTRPGEPSPREEQAPVVISEEAPAAAPPAQSEARSQAPQAPAQARAPAPPPAPPPVALIPSSKPRIVAKVESVQFPAWVERGGVRAAIKASWAIYTSDRIITGADGRVALSLAGEGRLQLGGAGEIAMTPAYEATGGAEPPVLTLRRGAMTLSAPMVRAGFGGMPIKLRDSIEATLLGGQIAARVDGEEDLLALVDGIVQISGPKLNPGAMKTANTLLRVPRAGRAQPVTPVGGERIAALVSESQLVRGQPTLDAAGTWDVSLNSGYNLKQLENMACRIQGRGYPTEIYPVREPGKQVWYRVVVRRFKSKNDAVDFLGTAKSLGAREPWVLLPQT